MDKIGALGRQQGLIGRDDVFSAVEGGEDYTLLCTAAPECSERIAEGYEAEFRRPLYNIGEITDSGRNELIYTDNKKEIIKKTGWDNFK